MVAITHVEIVVKKFEVLPVIDHEDPRGGVEE